MAGVVRVVGCSAKEGAQITLYGTQALPAMSSTQQNGSGQPVKRSFLAYDPNSFDAMVALMLQRMDTQDETLARIEEGMKERFASIEMDMRDQGDEIESLRTWRAEINSKIVIITGIVAGFGTIVGIIISAVVNKVIG